MKIGSLVLLGLLVTVGLSSCKKRNSSGFGGNAVLRIRAYHHTLAIYSFTAYVKFNAQDAPKDNIYDTQVSSVMNSDSTFSAQISGLKLGDYYLFVKGWDSTIQEEVKGGIHIKLKKNQLLMR